MLVRMASLMGLTNHQVGYLSKQTHHAIDRRWATVVCPLPTEPANSMPVQAPRPGFEPGTPSLEARHDVRFTTGAEAEGERVELTSPRGRTTLAPWPGQPYPAALRPTVDPPGVEPGSHPSSSSTMNPTTARSRTCDLSPFASEPGGSRTRTSSTPGWCSPVGRQAQDQWTAGESHPDFRLATAASSSSTSSPGKLRRPDLNRRRAAYETVLESRLQSTPQSVPPAGLEPAISSV